MTTKPDLSAAEIELKRRGRRRLIGAATLGLLAIVVLPMVFDSEPKSGAVGNKPVKQEIAINIPPKEGLPPVAAPVVPPPTPVAAPPVAAAPATPVTPVETKPTAETKPKAEPKTEPKPKVEPAKESFVVQIGAYKDVDNAKSIVAQLKEAKLPVVTDVISVKAGQVTRVRVGPYPTKSQADGALAQVKLAGADGKIVPVKP